MAGERAREERIPTALRGNPKDGGPCFLVFPFLSHVISALGVPHDTYLFLPLQCAVR